MNNITVSSLCRDLTAVWVDFVLVIHLLNTWCFTMPFGLQPQHTNARVLITSHARRKYMHLFWQALSQSLTSRLTWWGNRPFPLMKLSAELTEKYKAVVCSALPLCCFSFPFSPCSSTLDWTLFRLTVFFRSFITSPTNKPVENYLVEIRLFSFSFCISAFKSCWNIGRWSSFYSVNGVPDSKKCVLFVLFGPFFNVKINGKTLPFPLNVYASVCLPREILTWVL